MLVIKGGKLILYFKNFYLKLYLILFIILIIVYVFSMLYIVIKKKYIIFI